MVCMGILRREIKPKSITGDQNGLIYDHLDQGSVLKRGKKYSNLVGLHFGDRRISYQAISLQ